jgi:hypothetical protein
MRWRLTVETLVGHFLEKDVLQQISDSRGESLVSFDGIEVKDARVADVRWKVGKS